ncbi:MAG: 2-C-methyl-D-erythritol 2,4-cyclodiphosphate synthase [Clostridium sp.]|jgi:2-C-methyl-D-erythritol 2,4-cyclodiphosphate synthase|nr:2-C-methyl-D-erythritol 2,4-cyclodiphosphate synthase [Clostridium sp.]
MRIGQGFDFHRLVQGRKLILGGVEIPFEKGLLGHSDADVLVHAVIDALLGACTLGDIGILFPDTDEAYRDISSIKLLERVGEMILQKHIMVENIDTTILAQEPKLASYHVLMRTSIAKALGLDIEQVSIKAKTMEKMGLIGQGEGMAAQAVCLVSDLFDHSQDVTPMSCPGRCCAGVSLPTQE